eukprot:14277876-Ditylum_brightwellii.AAC.1
MRESRIESGSELEEGKRLVEEEISGKEKGRNTYEEKGWHGSLGVKSLGSGSKKKGNGYWYSYVSIDNLPRCICTGYISRSRQNWYLEQPDCSMCKYTIHNHMSFNLQEEESQIPSSH